MTTYRLYADPNLGIPLPGVQAQFQTGGSATARRIVYLGSRTAGRRLVPPAGSTAVTVEIVGPAAGAVRLATSAAGLGAALPGQALELGPVVKGTVEIHVEIDGAGLSAGEVLAQLLIEAEEEAKE